MVSLKDFLFLPSLFSILSPLYKKVLFFLLIETSWLAGKIERFSYLPNIRTLFYTFTPLILRLVFSICYLKDFLNSFNIRRILSP